MFIDTATVLVKAGDGGNGVVSFHHARGLPMGGPDGGDGGHGGSVVFIASNNENTLANFRFQKELKAEDGISGRAAKMHGRNGKDLEVNVPVGTQITKEGVVLADLTHSGERFVAAAGGRGGFGNAHFTSSTRQAPRVAEKGEEGDVQELALELKMIADVGLVGLPNAGKSTLLARISNARPEIANYAFTTLRPNLGVVKIEKGKELLFADIPGLIEGASHGKGLGFEFLRHLERTKIIACILDCSHTCEELVKNYHGLLTELLTYNSAFNEKKRLVVLNKIDLLSQEELAIRVKAFADISVTALPISAATGAGLNSLILSLGNILERLKIENE